MKTKSITLFYKITQDKVYAPSDQEIARKESWIEEMQKTVPSDYEWKVIKVTYEVYNPEVEDMRRFFEGVVVMYYAIQNGDMVKEIPSSDTLKRYRETILDAILAYDVRLGNLIKRKRASTTEFVDAQQWTTFLETVREELFDPSGYTFPDSKEFWKLVEKYGYDRAKESSIKRLQVSLQRKYDTNDKP